MKLSFLILNYKTPHHLRICLQNIRDLELDQAGITHEVIVVDNASNDGSAEMVAERFPEARLIVSDRNVGHPSGNNIGLRVAKGDYVAMINPDIILRSVEDLQKILGYLDRHPDVAFLGPKLHNPNGTVQSSCYRRYSRWTPAFRRTFLGKFGFAKRDIERHLMTDFDHNETREVDWLLGACLFIRRTAVETIGLMNEQLFLYFGDYEWCDRAKQQGWKVVYFHDANGIFHYHKRESASRRLSIQQMFSYVTRIHIKDWRTSLTIAKAYAKSA
jgi:hypothetical protein